MRKINWAISVLALLLFLAAGSASVMKSTGFHSSWVFQLERMLGGDKVLHLCVAFSLSLLSALAFNEKACRMTLVLLAIVITDEALQCFFPRREFSWLDMAVNVSGVCGGCVFFLIINKITRKVLG